MDRVVLTTNQVGFEIQGWDLTDMVGLAVKVTGAVKEVEGRKVLEAISVQQMESHAATGNFFVHRTIFLLTNFLNIVF